jgi:hypothetical protein
LRDRDIEKVVAMYRAFQTTTPLTREEGEVLEEKFAYRATIQEVEENEYNLNIPRYVDTFEEDEPSGYSCYSEKYYSAEKGINLQLNNKWIELLKGTGILIENRNMDKSKNLQFCKYGSIPKEWECLQLKEVTSKITNGLTYDSNLTHGLPITRIETISDGTINFEKAGTITKDEAKRRVFAKIG